MLQIIIQNLIKMKPVILSLVVGLALISCESVLEEKPKTQVNTGAFYQNEDHAIMALNAAYAQLKAGNGYYNQQFLTNVHASSDQGTGSWKHGDFHRGVLTSSNPVLPTTWEEIYVAIRDANNVIHNVPGIDMDEELKARILGEARFLRGLHYFNLARCFGEVPLRTQPVQPGEEDGLPVSSREEIYKVVISDFKFAEQHCWDRGESKGSYTNNVGRATKAAAQGLLARVYLHIASSARSAAQGVEGCMPYSSYSGDYITYYDSVKIYCDKVLEHPEYELVSSIEGWEAIFDAGNGNNAEIIWDIQAGTSTGQGSAIANLYSPRNSGLAGGGWGGTNTMKPGFVENNIDTADPRFNHAIIHQYETQTHYYVLVDKKKAYERYTLDGERKGTQWHVYTSKYIDRSATTEYTSQQNWHVLRLADIHLMRAEAMAEINLDPSLANADINLLRSRVGFEVDFNGTGLPMEEFRDLLLRERAAELLMEGVRFFDLVRLGKLEEKVKSAFDPKNQGLQEGIRGPEDYYWPIPITEISANENID